MPDDMRGPPSLTAGFITGPPLTGDPRLIGRRWLWRPRFHKAAAHGRRMRGQARSLNAFLAEARARWPGVRPTPRSSPLVIAVPPVLLILYGLPARSVAELRGRARQALEYLAARCELVTRKRLPEGSSLTILGTADSSLGFVTAGSERKVPRRTPSGRLADPYEIRSIVRPAKYLPLLPDCGCAAGKARIRDFDSTRKGSIPCMIGKRRPDPPPLGGARKPWERRSSALNVAFPA